MNMQKVGRNDPCPCGSGKKYKHCHMQQDQSRAADAHAAPRQAAPQIPAAINAALAHHNVGRLQEAEAIYRQVLRAEPNHPDALHLLGLIAHQAGKSDLAIELIGKAIKAKPSDPLYHSNLGNMLRERGSLERAVKWARRNPAGAGMVALGLLLAAAVVWTGVAQSYNAELVAGKQKLESANAELTLEKSEAERLRGVAEAERARAARQ